MHLLLAEDDKISRDLLRRIIESEAHTATLVQDGEEAWKVLSDGTTHFDACIFDICMPSVSGLDLVERMRASEVFRRTPIILCSAVNDRPTVQRAVGLSVTHYVVKPYSRTVMLDKLRQIRTALAESAVNLEPADVVCKRLGIDADIHRDMVSGTIDEAASWAQGVRTAAGRPDWDKLFIRGRGLKGSCLTIGLSGAAAKIESVETLLQQHLGSAPELTANLPKEQVENLLTELERELATVKSRLKIAA